MKRRVEPPPRFSAFDWGLIVVNVALVFLGVFYGLMSPTWWGRCLDILDVRNWTHWTWTGLAVALFGFLWLVQKYAKKAG